MATASAPDPMAKPLRKRIRPVLLVLLWVWALCIFLVVDLFFNVNEFDAVRPRSSLYTGTRLAAHKLVGEPIAEPGAMPAPSPRAGTGPGGDAGGALARGPEAWGPRDPLWGPRGMIGPTAPASSGPPAVNATPGSGAESKPVFHPSPRSVTPRVVRLDADLSQERHGSWTVWNEPEGKAAERDVVDGRREGRWLWTWADGKQREERNYRRGRLNGFVRSWYGDGKPQVEEQYVDGEPEGRWRAWYGGGQLAWEENYQDGAKEGDVTWFHPNGVMSLQGQYRAGQPVGEWVHRDTRGEVVERRTFE